jgi:putative DNA-invertase from lambdoid prophage Rac
LLDLIGSLQELSAVGVGFVSLCEALDLTTPSGRALAGMLSVFAEFERKILLERVRLALRKPEREVSHGRPRSSKHAVPKFNVSSPGDSVNARSPNG